MISLLRARKRTLNVLLSLSAIGLEVFYSICAGSCSYLRGTVFGFDLTYVGIIFAVILIALNLLKRDLLILALLSAGVGAEIVLASFQIRNNVYCPYCLGFGGIILLLCIVNFDVRRKAVVAVSVVLGFLMFSVFFKGSVVPAYAYRNSDLIFLSSFRNNNLV